MYTASIATEMCISLAVKVCEPELVCVCGLMCQADTETKSVSESCAESRFQHVSRISTNENACNWTADETKDKNLCDLMIAKSTTATSLHRVKKFKREKKITEH